MSFLGIGGPSAFDKKITQNSQTTNTDNSRVATLTDSLNTAITQNLALTKADSRVYNSAFDAIDSFNSVASFELQNIGGGPANIPTLDFTGLRSLFTNPADLSKLINANTISADPNANKYGFDFSAQSQTGSDFLKGVQGLVSDTWKGLTAATTAAQPVAPNESVMKYAVIGGALLLGLIVLLKFRR